MRSKLQNVVVWLKIREHDITELQPVLMCQVVVWLKIREHDISGSNFKPVLAVVVWLKIREHDITLLFLGPHTLLWFD